MDHGGRNAGKGLAIYRRCIWSVREICCDSTQCLLDGCPPNGRSRSGGSLVGETKLNSYQFVLGASHPGCASGLVTPRHLRSCRAKRGRSSGRSGDLARDSSPASRKSPRRSATAPVLERVSRFRQRWPIEIDPMDDRKLRRAAIKAGRDHSS
jgi:hypothetical protein